MNEMKVTMKVRGRRELEWRALQRANYAGFQASGNVTPYALDDRFAEDDWTPVVACLGRATAARAGQKQRVQSCFSTDPRRATHSRLFSTLLPVTTVQSHYI